MSSHWEEVIWRHNYVTLLLLNQVLVTRICNFLFSWDEEESHKAHALNLRCGMSGVFSAESDGTRVMKSTNRAFFRSFSFISEKEQNLQQGFVNKFQSIQYFCVEFKAKLGVTEHVHSLFFSLCALLIDTCLSPFQHTWRGLGVTLFLCIYSEWC